MVNKKLVWQDYKKKITDSKITYLPSGYNPKHKNTMGHKQIKEVLFIDYTEKMLRKIYGYKTKMAIKKDNMVVQKLLNV